MAQLREEGEDVPLLVMAHSMNPQALHAIGGLKLRLSKARFHARQWLREHAHERASYLRDRMQAVLEELRIARARVAEGTHGALRADLDRAAYAYRPPLYGGDVALFTPYERPDVLDPRPGWAQVVRGWFRPHEIAGGHSTMLQHPHVAEFAEHLRQALAEARQDSGQYRRRAA